MSRIYMIDHNHTTGTQLILFNAGGTQGLVSAKYGEGDRL